MGATRSSKRRPPSSLLRRRVRARKEEPAQLEPAWAQSSAEDDDGESERGDDSPESEDEDRTGRGPAPASSEEDEDEDGSGSGADAPAAVDPSTISFGALARAQASLQADPRRKKSEKEREKARRRRGGTDADAADPAPVSDSGSAADAGDAAREGREWKAEDGHRHRRVPPPGRSSKNAPTEQSSKRAVSRKRQVVPLPRAGARDPRFLALDGGAPGGGASGSETARARYAFLEQYREGEMATLRAAVRTTKDAEARQQLRRALAVMQSRKQTQERRDEEARVIAEHRRRDKELVAQGKQPFYLKKSERKKQVLLDRYAGMKDSQVDKAIERKRKKVSSKEKKELPWERRQK